MSPLMGGPHSGTGKARCLRLDGPTAHPGFWIPAGNPHPKIVTIVVRFGDIRAFALAYPLGIMNMSHRQARRYLSLFRRHDAGDPR